MGPDLTKIADTNREVSSVFALIVMFIALAAAALLLRSSPQYMFIFMLATLVMGIWIMRHLTLPNDERMAKIFETLKKKGGVDRDREIKYDRRGQMFRAGLIFYNTIFYNKNGCSLDEFSIIFALLHEEGHIVCKKYATPFIFTLLLIFIPLFFLFISYGELVASGIFHALLWYVTIICFSLLLIINLLFEPMKNDEYRSDEYAAQVLKEKYNVLQPSLIADNALKAMRKMAGKESRLKTVFSSLFRYSPRDEDRVRNIREKYDFH